MSDIIRIVLSWGCKHISKSRLEADNSAVELWAVPHMTEKETVNVALGITENMGQLMDGYRAVGQNNLFQHIMNRFAESHGLLRWLKIMGKPCYSLFKGSQSEKISSIVFILKMSAWKDACRKAHTEVAIAGYTRYILEGGGRIIKMPHGIIFLNKKIHAAIRNIGNDILCAVKFIKQQGAGLGDSMLTVLSCIKG